MRKLARTQRPRLAVALLTILGGVLQACTTTDSVPDAPPSVGPASLIYENRVGFPNGPIEQLRVAAHPLLDLSLPAYVVAFVHETPRTSGSPNRTLIAATTNAAFGAPAFLPLGTSFERRIPTLHDAIWVNDSLGRTTWMLVGSAIGADRPSDPRRRYWLWSEGPLGPSGNTGLFDFTTVTAAEESSIGRRYDLIRAGGSKDKDGQYLIVARRSQGLDEFAEGDCLVAWLPTMFVPPPPHDPFGLYRNEPFILDCAPNAGAIAHVAVSSLARGTPGAWLVVYTKNNLICALAITSTSGLVTTPPATASNGCGVTTLLSTSLPVRELEVDGGARSRFLVAYTQDRPRGRGSLVNLNVLPVLVAGGVIPSGTVFAPRLLGTTTGGIRIADESASGAHWMLLDGGGIGGNLSYTRVKRLGHTGQIVQEFALRPPPWPFVHDVAYSPATDRFGVVRPLLESTAGLYGLTVPHTQADQATFVGSGCAGTISITGPTELHAIATGTVTGTVTRHFSGHNLYNLVLTGPPAGTSVTLEWSPRLLRRPGNCADMPDTAFTGTSSPDYLPRAGSATTVVGSAGTATQAVALSDLPGTTPPGVFPATTNVPLDTPLYFQWTWTEQVITPPTIDDPDRPVISNVTRRSNIAHVRFNP